MYSYDKREVLNIVDANTYLFKSYEAYDPVLDTKGRDQRVLTGVLDAIISIIYHATRHNPMIPSNMPQPKNHFIFVFDAPDGSAYRKALFSEYKENRPPKEEEFIKQVNFALRILRECVGIPIVIYPGFEADDAVGSIANLYKGEYKINIYSVDKDLSQLVDKDVSLIRKIKKKGDEYGKFVTYNIEDVIEEYGVEPALIPDLLALMGDTVDNLPGLDNIGPKKAAKILSEYPSVEHLIAYKDHIKNEVLKNQINEYKNLLPLVKKLATIKCDLPIEQMFLDACEYSEKIRSHPKYAENFLRMEKALNWKPKFRDFFTS